MMGRIDAETIRYLFLIQPAKPEDEAREIERRQQTPAATVAISSRPRPSRSSQARRAGAKVGRNDPCPCGSGKKYKKCCGKGS